MENINVVQLTGLTSFGNIMLVRRFNVGASNAIRAKGVQWRGSLFLLLAFSAAEYKVKNNSRKMQAKKTENILRTRHLYCLIKKCRWTLRNFGSKVTSTRLKTLLSALLFPFVLSETIFGHCHCAWVERFLRCCVLSTVYLQIRINELLMRRDGTKPREFEPPFDEATRRHQLMDTVNHVA